MLPRGKVFLIVLFSDEFHFRDCRRRMKWDNTASSLVRLVIPRFSMTSSNGNTEFKNITGPQEDFEVFVVSLHWYRSMNEIFSIAAIFIVV